MTIIVIVANISRRLVSAKSRADIHFVGFITLIRSNAIAPFGIEMLIMPIAAATIVILTAKGEGPKD